MERKGREAARYLGYGASEADAPTQRLIGECFEELSQAAQFRIVSRIFDIRREADGTLQIGIMRIASRKLSGNLAGCAQAAVLGATLGVQTDLLMKRYSCTDMARAVVLQACAAAELEERLDRWQEAFGQEMRAQGLWLRPRFSPGYGDFSISHQGEILAMLDAGKRIGLSMTDSSMLTPTKSVTALIGLGRERTDCASGGCEACESADCPYRRNDR